jgi:hypothetical protein
LATPQSAAGPEGPAESGRTIVRALKRCNGLDCDFATSPKGRATALGELGGNTTVICGCSRDRATAAALFKRGSKGGRSPKTLSAAALDRHFAPLLAKTATGTEPHPNENERPKTSSPPPRQYLSRSQTLARAAARQPRDCIKQTLGDFAILP